MKILITGGSGLLGKYLLKTTPPDCQIAMTWHKNSNVETSTPGIWYRLDIRNRTEIFELFEIFRPNLIIHCASIGGVDYAEDHYQQVLEVNAGGTEHLVDAANGYKSKIIYISTNAVFSGELPPYNEKSPLEPVNGYGSIKRQAENIIRERASKWLIIRPFMLYGWPHPGGRTNWPAHLVERLSVSDSCKLVNDHIWMPTYAGDMAETIWKLADQHGEIYNVAGPDRATLYDFGLSVCRVFRLPERLIEPVKSGYFPGIAKRPKDTTYDLVKLAGQGIRLSGIDEGLMKMKEEKL